MRIAVTLAMIVGTGLSWHGLAYAQVVDRRYAEEPTGGVAMPTTPLAGDHDARAVDANAGGLALLRGPEAALVFDREDSSVADAAGPGFGAYAATSGGGELVPRYGLGIGLEWLRPPRALLAPDPGTPFRFTLAWAIGLGHDAGFGMAWHHFLGEGALDGVNAFDLGLSTRWGNHLAIGAVLRDLATSAIANTPVQRRYELEAVVRPFATNALEIAVGGEVGETRGDVGGWGRLAVRAARGVTLLAQLETRELHAIEDSPLGLRDVDGRDVRATIGIELSLGNFGVTGLGTGLRNDAGANHPLGGTAIVRLSAIGPPSLIGPADHIERVELQGDIATRDLTTQVMRLREIAHDPSAKALVVVFDGVAAGFATLQELRDEILNVRRAGKKVFAYMVSGTGRDYYIASAADKIYVDPAGGIRLVGLAATSFYFRGTFDELGVLPQFEKIGEYKSAPEQFTETGPTEVAATMHRELYDSLWDQWVSAVAAGRHLSSEEVKAIVDNGPYTAGDLAKDQRLVDAVAPPDKIAKLITAEMHADLAVGTAAIERPERWQRPGVAVIYVDGDITDGKSKSLPLLGQNLAGGETLVAAIVEARSNPRVGAIILRINSPGGSALASELVAREVFATRGVKPILCSMSDLAASGGYFIAAGCDLIFAEPTTITGSIGIFFGKFDVSGLLRKLGITTDTYKHGKRADLESMFRPFTDEERAVMLDKLRYGYGRFVGAVAAGRKLDKDAVDKLGRGHVYTGAQAKPLALVDRFGGLGDALVEAKRRMHLEPDTKIQLYELPNQPSSLFGVLGDLAGAGARSAAFFELPVVRELARGIPASVLMSPDSAQARLPFDVVFE